MWPIPSRLVLIAGFALAVFVVGFASGYKWQSGTIADLKLAQSESSRKGWESALNLYREEQERADTVVTESQTKITGLRAELAGARAKLKAAQKASPECKSWSEQRIACPL